MNSATKRKSSTDIDKAVISQDSITALFEVTPYVCVYVCMYVLQILSVHMYVRMYVCIDVRMNLSLFRVTIFVSLLC